MPKPSLFVTGCLLLMTVVLIIPSAQAHGNHQPVQDTEMHFSVHMERLIPGSFEFTGSGWVVNSKQNETRQDLELPVSHLHKS